ncbi:MAG: 2-oxoglutarate dehydrogenase E1 component [Candidatus Sumerlaeia bacterium]|nr:2-oxoglutarate dehydrogenase E1 component [Candidatus Sumerlaeia bacterium]
MSQTGNAANSSINGWNAEYIEAQFQQWKQDPAAVGKDWDFFFQGFTMGLAESPSTARHAPVTPNVEAMVSYYRVFGHNYAAVNPLYPPKPKAEFYKLEKFHLSDADLERDFDIGWFRGGGRMKLRDLIAELDATYLGPVGVELGHMNNTDERAWLLERIEKHKNRTQFTREEKLRILELLAKAETYETFAHRTYVGKKRFSIEGGETLIPLLDEIVETAAATGVEEIIFGMAHRGRLNVLANTLNKSYGLIFSEYEDIPEVNGDDAAGGDVKYHLGAVTDRPTRSGRTIHLSMTANPSHLELVGAVVQGRVRGKQYLRGDNERKRVVPVVMHGDAAFSGQGIVAEIFNMSQLPAYRTGGTIHIVINNQVGFTTAPEYGRSTPYCTDVAKMVEAPIFHVNTEDPEAAAHIARLAFEYRQKFQKDIVIDLVCYRRYGHNEGDEPSFTQPVMYKAIRDKQTTRHRYLETLLAEGVLTKEQFDGAEADFRRMLEAAQASAKEGSVEKPKDVFGQGWVGYTDEYSHDPMETGVPAAKLRELGLRLSTIPEGFNANPKVKRILQEREKAVERGDGIDWANAESLAFASLLVDGHLVRLTGQDSRRGTFSQRHACLWDTETEATHYPHEHLGPGQGRVVISDSPLSEVSVLAFEYGVSLVAPNGLVMWEAQFGDFANCAQAVIDEYLVSAESKWDRHSGLVLLLPHGYEGQGPDHSSAHIERFLQLAAEDNIQVVNASTPAQYFHLLRRQVKRNFRKPLVVATPKSLLRNPAATSTLAELASGHFREVIADPVVAPERAERVILCSGKFYYELAAKRDGLELKDTAIVRIEQFHPFPERQLAALFAQMPRAKSFIWAQEESENAGAWSYLEPLLRKLLGREVAYIGRPRGASTSTGSLHQHEIEQARLLDAAFPSARAKKPVHA